MKKDTKGKQRLADLLGDPQATKMNGAPVVNISALYNEAGELIQEKVELTQRTSSQVEISVDSKGNIKPNVRVSHEDPYEALKQALDIFDKAMGHFSGMS